jgi:hypothetical protein
METWSPVTETTTKNNHIHPVGECNYPSLSHEQVLGSPYLQTRYNAFAFSPHATDPSVSAAEVKALFGNDTFKPVCAQTYIPNKTT